MIVIPMVGKSSRFFNAGYSEPKFKLPIQDTNVFVKVMQSFSGLFEDELFLFLVRTDFNAKAFVEREVQNLGIKRYKIKLINQDTQGQAETVYIGTEDIDKEEPLTIFNIDTFRSNFQYPSWISDCDGYLEVFEGSGDNWSFVKPGEELKVIQTTEKEPISDLCSDGLYFFRKKEYFDQAFSEFKRKNAKVRGEFYIAPLYNTLIERGFDIRYFLINKNEVTFCGTPEEYIQLK